MTTPRYRLYRDPVNGWLGGVCAGLSQYFALDVRLIRIGLVLGIMFLTVPTLLAYLAMVVFVPRRPDRSPFGSTEEERVRRSVHLAPHETLREARMKFQDCAERISRLEEAVLSEEFKLRREFRDIR